MPTTLKVNGGAPVKALCFAGQRRQAERDMDSLESLSESPAKFVRFRAERGMRLLRATGLGQFPQASCHFGETDRALVGLAQRLLEGHDLCFINGEALAPSP